MKAPTDKQNDTIQVMVTRSCDLFRCSNCTQLLPFRKDALNMSVDSFRSAVRSLRDWPGVIGLFGGNPCSHPRFSDLCSILCEEVKEQRRRGIWTNNLLGKGPVVRQTFYPDGRFNLNAHGRPDAAAEIERWLPGKLIPGSGSKQSVHSSILTSWRDLGLTDDEWVEAREKCDVNLRWSAAIAERDGEPRGYFCEIAASIDGIRGTNCGIELTDRWWAQGMSAFSHQVAACCDAGCGIPLKLKGHVDDAQVYDVTNSWRKHTTCGLSGLVGISDPGTEGCSEATDYMRMRTCQNNRCP